MQADAELLKRLHHEPGVLDAVSQLIEFLLAAVPDDEGHAVSGGVGDHHGKHG